jgi:hypothetical protein
MNVWQLVERELAGETEVLGENPHHWHYIHRKSHLIWDRTQASVMGNLRIIARSVMWSVMN